MDVSNLLKALDNDDNSRYLDLTHDIINEDRINILNELNISDETIKEYNKKLENYIYIDDLNNLREGSYVRWVPLEDPDNIYLTPGGIFCETKITDDGLVLICKNFVKKHFEIKIEECLLFQKLSQQEQVLISALDYLSK